MKKIFVILFVAVLIGFSVTNLIMPAKEFSETENRYLAKLPEFSSEELFFGDYTNQFEKYVTDSVFLRDSFIYLKSNTEKLLGKYDNNGVYFAGDDYLIDKEPTFNEEILKKNVDAINILAKSGKYNVSFSLIPTAYEILKDKLPLYAYNDIQQKTLDYVKTNLKNVNFIDSYNTLHSNKAKYIYYRTDHHQTMDGSFLVYNDIMNSLDITPLSDDAFIREIVSDSFFGTTWSKTPLNVNGDEIIKYTPVSDIEYTVNYIDKNKTVNTLYADENLNKKDKYTYYMDGNNSLITVNTNIKNGKKLAVIKDSYAHSIIPFIANHYEEIHVLDLRYYNLNPDIYFSENNIKDVLFIYNAANFLTDNNLVKITAYMSDK